MELAPVPIVSAFRRASVRLPGSVHTLLCSRRLRSTVALLALVVLISLPLQWLGAREVFALIYRGRGPPLLQAIMHVRAQYPLDYYNYSGRLDAVFSLWAMIVVVSTAYLVALTWPLAALRQHPLVYRLSGLREQVARVELLWVVLGAATLSLLATVANAILRTPALRWWSLGPEGKDFPSWHSAIMDGESLAPIQYRILTPYLSEGVHQLGFSLLASYDVVRWIAMFLTMVAFYFYARRWLSGPLAGLCLVVLTATLPFTYLPQVQCLDVELLVFTLGLWAIRDRRDAVLVPLVLVGTLNKETAVLLVAFWAVNRIGVSAWPFSRGVRITSEDGWPRTAVTAGALLVAWTLPFVGVRLWFGLREYGCDLIMLKYNLVHLASYVFPLVLFGPLWYLAIRGVSRAPAFLRRCLLVVPLYFAICWVAARPEEVRLFLILTPIILPLAAIEMEAKLTRKPPAVGV